MRRNAFLPMLAAALSAAACLGGAVPNARLWGDGDRVVFFGDSITHGGAYPEYISLYYATRFPGKDIWFSNSGWSGASAPQGIASIDEDVAAKKPTVVTVMFGMNDVGRNLWPREGKSQTVTPAQKGRLDAFAANMTNLVSLVRAKAGAPEIVYVTPSPFDQTCVDGEKLSDVVCNDGLALLAEKVRGWAKKDGAMCVDLQSAIYALNAKMQRKDPSFSILRKENGSLDRVHPGALGHMAFAYYWLTAQGAPSLVARIDVNSATLGAARSEGAEVTDVKGDRRGVSFTALESALPYPFTGAMFKINELVPFVDSLDQELLVVRNLRAGEYEVKIDGVVVGSWPGADLGRGVNLATCFKAPQYLQAQRVREINARIWALERTVRLFLTRRRWARMHYKIDPDDLTAVVGILRGLEEKGRAKGNYDYATYSEYLKAWPKRVETYAALDAARAALREAARPVPHKFEITRK